MAQNTEIITKVDIGSDHRMVRSRICINKRLERPKRIKRKKPPRIDVRQLEKVAPIFLLELQNRFEVLANESPSIEILNESITKTAAEVSKKRIETEEEVNTEDKVIEQLEQRRKELKKKDNKTRAERVEYSEANKTVKKKRRARARRKRKDFVIKKVENMEEQLNVLNNISLESGLKMHKGKTKYMNNFESNKDITIDKETIEKVESYKYLGQTTYLKETTKEEVTCRIRAGWSCFGRNREIFLDDKMPISLKRQVYDQCVLPTMTYGCQTWSLTKATTQKLRVAQRAMERKILGIKLADRVKCSEIRKRTQIQDIVDFVAKQKWKWAGHVARFKDNRWTLRVTEWQPRNGKRSRGRQARRWRDDIVKTRGNTWSRDARDRDEWKRDAEGYILQWMDRAS
ncbi:protein sidekick-1 [Plakobranchus ocellatus]|uniref:Protein sidekick-1 n=1 Tax=Plakobranchus ocellatus TaxID=259542 RepID=A0AAV3Y424_9GAST|nr:protein sidekick-1 [Plakobranchus ocellatus]